jgi:phosphatidate phosphatase PAH1
MEAMLSAVESLFQGFGNRAEIVFSIKDIEIPANNIMITSKFHIILEIN